MLLMGLLEVAFALTVTVEGADTFDINPLSLFVGSQPKNLESLGSANGTIENWFILKRFDTLNCDGTLSIFVAGPGCEDSSGECCGRQRQLERQLEL